MGERGPKTTPVALQLLRGDPRKLGKARLGALLDETIRPPVEIPDAPASLRGEALSEWERIAPHLAKLGLISQIDRAALAAYCTAWGDFVWAENRVAALNDAARELGDKTGEHGRIWDTPSGYKQISVPLQIRNRAMEVMAKFLAEFGMSPAARSRVTASDPQVSLPGFDEPQEGGWGKFK
jgi:P27 family predicted phage terminase small subunit